MPWIASKYCSALRRIATADASGRFPRRSATSVEVETSTTARHAPALEQGHQEDAARREIEDVLRAAVRRAAHLDDLECAKEVAAPLEVARDDHPVGQGFLDAPARVPMVGRTDLRDEEGRAALRAQRSPEAQEEVANPFLLPQAVAHGGHGVQDEPPHVVLVDHPADRLDEPPGGLHVDDLLVDPELLVDLREVDELQLPLPHQLVVEEVERDHVLQELLCRLGDAEVEGVLAVQGAPHEELDADGRLARADGPRHEDRVAPRDAAVQDVVNPVDARDASLALAAEIAILRRHLSPR